MKIKGIIKAISPIYHGGDEKTGSTPILRSIAIFDGSKQYIIPYVSGNSIRGKLRRLIMKDFFIMLDYEPDIKIHHVFYSGGVLESTEEMYSYLDLEMRKKIRNFLIPLSLFGASIGNQVIQGKLLVGHAYPICKEYKNFLPEEYQRLPEAQISVRNFTDSSFITRRDELQVEDDITVQMKVDYECFIPGTVFYHWFALDYPTDLEFSCFSRVINLLKANPYIGGRSAQGDGNITFKYDIELPDDKFYIQFVLQNKEEIKKIINSLFIQKQDIKENYENWTATKRI